eukprot:jgi/Galph1/5728/GphlegSOOS_G4393.1
MEENELLERVLVSATVTIKRNGFDLFFCDMIPILIVLFVNLRKSNGVLKQYHFESSIHCLSVCHSTFKVAVALERNKVTVLKKVAEWQWEEDLRLYFPQQENTVQKCVQQLSWSADGSRLAAFGDGVIIWQWVPEEQATTSQSMRRHQMFQLPICSQVTVLLEMSQMQLGCYAYHGALAPDGNFFAVAGWKSKKINVWRVDSLIDSSTSELSPKKNGSVTSPRRYSLSGTSRSDSSSVSFVTKPSAAELQVGESGMIHCEWKQSRIGRNALLTLDADGTIRLWSKKSHSRRVGGHEWMKQVARTPHISGEENISTACFIEWKDYHGLMEEEQVDPLWSMMTSDLAGFKLSKAVHWILQICKDIPKLWRVRGLNDLPFVSYTRLDTWKDWQSEKEGSCSYPTFGLSKAIAPDWYRSNLHLDPSRAAEGLFRMNFPSFPPSWIDCITSKQLNWLSCLTYYGMLMEGSCCQVYQVPIEMSMGHQGMVRQVIQNTVMEEGNDLSVRSWLVSCSPSIREYWIWLLYPWKLEMYPMARCYRYSTCCFVEKDEILLALDDTLPQLQILFLSHTSKQTVHNVTVYLPKVIWETIYKKKVTLLNSDISKRNAMEKKMMQVLIFNGQTIYLWYIQLDKESCLVDWQVYIKSCKHADIRRDGVLSYLYVLEEEPFQLNIYGKCHSLDEFEDWHCVDTLSVDKNSLSIQNMVISRDGRLVAILYEDYQHVSWIRFGEYPKLQWFKVYTSFSPLQDSLLSSFDDFRWDENVTKDGFYLSWKASGESTHGISYCYHRNGIMQVPYGTRDKRLQLLPCQANCWLSYRDHQLYLSQTQNSCKMDRRESLREPSWVFFWFCVVHHRGCLSSILHSIALSIVSVAKDISQQHQKNRTFSYYNSIWILLLHSLFLKDNTNLDSSVLSLDSKNYEDTTQQIEDQPLQDIQKAIFFLSDETNKFLSTKEEDYLLADWLHSYLLLVSFQLSLDTFSFKYLMVSHFWWKRHGVLQSQQILPMPFILWAVYSTCSKAIYDVLFRREMTTTGMDPSIFHDASISVDKRCFVSLWHYYRYYGVGFWVDHQEDLKHIAESCAKAAFQQRQDPMDVCLWYVLLQRTKTLALLFKTKGIQKYYEFFMSDFKDKKTQVKTRKNAYVALSRHRLELACALFVLSGDWLEGLKLLLRKLQDVQLYLVASQLLFAWNENVHTRDVILDELQAYLLTTTAEEEGYMTWLLYKRLNTKQLIDKNQVDDLWSFLSPLVTDSIDMEIELHCLEEKGIVSSWLQTLLQLQCQFFSMSTFFSYYPVMKKELLWYPNLLIEFGKVLFSNYPITSLGCWYSVLEYMNLSLDAFLQKEQRWETLIGTLYLSLMELDGSVLETCGSFIHMILQKLIILFRKCKKFPSCLLSEEMWWKKVKEKRIEWLCFLWQGKEWLGLSNVSSEEWKSWWYLWLFRWIHMMMDIIEEWLLKGVEEDWENDGLLSSPNYHQIQKTIESLEESKQSFIFLFPTLWKELESVHSFYRWFIFMVKAINEMNVSALLSHIELPLSRCTMKQDGEQESIKWQEIPSMSTPLRLRKVFSSHQIKDVSAVYGTEETMNKKKEPFIPCLAPFCRLFRNEVKRQALVALLKRALLMHIIRQFSILSSSLKGRGKHVKSKLMWSVQSLMESMYRKWSKGEIPLVQSTAQVDELHRLFVNLCKKSECCKRLLQDGWMLLDTISQTTVKENGTVCAFDTKLSNDVDLHTFPFRFSTYHSICLWKEEKEAIRSFCVSSDDPPCIAIATNSGLRDLSPYRDIIESDRHRVKLNRSHSAGSFEHEPDSVIARNGLESTIWKYAPQALYLVADPVRRKYASGHADGTIKLWNFADAFHLGQWKVPSVGRVSSLAFSSYGDRLLACHATGQLVLWDEPFLAVGRQTVALPIIIDAFGKRRASQAIFVDDRNVIAVVGSPQGAIASGNSLLVYDIRSPHYDVRPDWSCKVNHGKESRCLVLLEDRWRIVTGGIDGSISMVDIRMHHSIADLAQVHSGEIQTISLESTRGRALFTGCSNGEGHLWDTRTMKCLDSISLEERRKKPPLLLSSIQNWKTSLTNHGILSSFLTDTCLLVGCGNSSLRLWGKGWQEE